MRIFSNRIALAAVAAVGLIALQATSCGGGGSPSSATPPTTVKATPTPTPPTGGGGSPSCTLGNGSPDAACEKGSSRLMNAVLAAQDLLVQQKPQIFDQTKESGAGTGQYLVLDKNAYLNGLVSNLAAAGYCAQRDPDDYAYERLQVKSENGFSENFDVLSSDDFMRRSKGIYLETCTPASFPVDRTGLPPAGSGCGAPYPPPISRMNCKWYSGGDPTQLDSTAIVGPDSNYCASIGYDDGRSLCPVRKDGAPDKEACQEWRVGHAKDTGRPGPTWTNSSGDYCTGRASGCDNYPDNQFELYVYTSGTYTVCAQTGACCSVVVQK
ncbi:MAG TPA: hypothetical protein VL691_00395 [Vicinamibacteria bacterium]|nr:hypothetical protein [Vicinamibacteria bacterium]